MRWIGMVLVVIISLIVGMVPAKSDENAIQPKSAKVIASWKYQAIYDANTAIIQMFNDDKNLLVCTGWSTIIDDVRNDVIGFEYFTSKNSTVPKFKATYAFPTNYKRYRFVGFNRNIAYVIYMTDTNATLVGAFKISKAGVELVGSYDISESEGYMFRDTRLHGSVLFVKRHVGESAIYMGFDPMLKKVIVQYINEEYYTHHINNIGSKLNEKYWSRYTNTEDDIYELQILKF